MSNKSGDGRRVQRVEVEVQKTIAQYLISGFRAPLGGLITVSKVIMPADLRTAKVYVSVLGDDEVRSQSLEKLNERAFEVQKYIGNELKLRYCPKLVFYPDHTTEQVLKIDKILNEVKSIKPVSGLPDESEQ